jgi:putative oxidoreductase
MTQRSTTPSAATGGLGRPIDWVIQLFERIPHGLVAVLARFAMAATFWLSGRTKVAEGTLLGLSDSAVFLFKEEYALPLLSPVVAGHLALYGEHVLPILLLIGLATRFAAAGLLAMTLVIQLFVYPDAYATHASWAACLLIIMARGPGPIALDHVIKARFGHHVP